MKTLFNFLLISSICLSSVLLTGCNTTHGLSQDINNASDSVHNAVNS